MNHNKNINKYLIFLIPLLFAIVFVASMVTVNGATVKKEKTNKVYASGSFYVIAQKTNGSVIGHKNVNLKWNSKGTAPTWSDIQNASRALPASLSGGSGTMKLTASSYQTTKSQSLKDSSYIGGGIDRSANYPHYVMPKVNITVPAGYLYDSTSYDVPSSNIELPARAVRIPIDFTKSTDSNRTCTIALAHNVATYGLKTFNQYKFTGMGATIKFKPATYKIKYDLAGGTFGENHPTSATYDSTFTVNNPTKSGYEFTGWKIKSSNKSITSTKDTSFKNLSAINGDTVTFTAQWDEAYAVLDKSNNTLTFFKDIENKYSNGQTEGTKTYYTGVENTGTEYPQWSHWKNEDRKIINKVIFEDEIQPVSCCRWFMGLENLTEISGLKKLDTSKCTNMEDMFDSCKKLTSLDLSNFDTSKVTRMDYMFACCDDLSSLDVSHFNTSNVKRMDTMFFGCEKLTSLNVSNFNTSKVTDMSHMFYRCEKLTSLDLNNFNTSNVEDMRSMFACCYNLTSLNISNFNTSKVTRMDNMFSSCDGLKSINLSHFNTSKVENMSHMFGYCDNLESIDLSSFNTSNVTDMSYMFAYSGNLKSIDLSRFDTSKVTDMSYMFAFCHNLTTTLNIANMPVSDRFDNSYENMCESASNDCGKLTLKYISPVTSANIDTLVATKNSSRSNVVNGGQGSLVK